MVLPRPFPSFASLVTFRHARSRRWAGCPPTRAPPPPRLRQARAAESAALQAALSTREAELAGSRARIALLEAAVADLKKASDGLTVHKISAAANLRAHLEEKARASKCEEGAPVCGG